MTLQIAIFFSVLKFSSKYLLYSDVIYYRFNTGVFLKIVFFYIFLVICIKKFPWIISALPAAADTVRL